MSNKDKIKEIIKNDFDKNNNYDMIKERMEIKHNNSYLEYGIIPIVLVIFISIVLLSKNANQIKEFKSSNVNVNSDMSTTSLYSNDYDILNSSTSIVFNELKDYKVKEINSKNYLNNVNIPYFDVLKDINIPDDFDNLEDGRAVCIKNKKDKDYGKINNYEFWYYNSKNKRSIIIALSDKNILYRDFKIDRENSKKTIINGVEIEIYKYKNIFVSIFNYKGYNFDIETRDITLEEFVMLLYSVIKK